MQQRSNAGRPGLPGYVVRTGLLVAVVGLSSVLVNWVGSGDRERLTLAFLGLGVVTIAVMIQHNWRTGIYAFLVWLIFEDLPRKYLGNNMAIYFAKDLLAGVAYLVLLIAVIRRGEQTFRPRFLLPLFLFFILGALQVFNPYSPSVFYGFMGLKLYFYYVPLMLLGYALIDSEMELRRFLVFNLSLAVVVALLGIVQAIVGLDFLNPSELPAELHLAHLIRRVPTSGVEVPRPTSVFVSDGRFGSYLLLTLLMSLGAAGYLGWRKDRSRYLAILSAALAATAILLLGSRGIFVYGLASFLLFIPVLLHYGPFRGKNRLWRAFQLSCIASSFGLLGVLVGFPEAVGARWAFYSETLNPDSPYFELTYRAWDYPVTEFVKAFSYPHWLAGYGIGTACLGGQYVRNILGAPASGVGVESGYGTLVLELGIIGLVLWWAWTAALIYWAWRALRRLLGDALFPLGFVILWFAWLLLFPFTFGSLASYQNFIFNAYFWLLVGVLFRLPDLATARQPARHSHLAVTGYGG